MRHFLSRYLIVARVLDGSKWIRQSWDQTDRELQRLCLLLWVCGIALLVIGIIGDARNWWSSAPFLTNVASSLDGAFFGIPVALIVLQRIVDVQQNVQQRREVVISAEQAGINLLRATLETIPQPDTIEQVLQIMESIRSRAKAFSQLGGPLRDSEKKTRFQQEAQQFVGLAASVKPLVLEYSQLERKSQAIRYRLDYLEDYIQPRIMDLDLAEIDAAARTDLRRALIPVVEHVLNYGNYPSRMDEVISEALERSDNYIDALEGAYSYFMRIIIFIECSADICVSLGLETSYLVQGVHCAFPPGPVKMRDLLSNQRPNYLVD